MNLKDYKAMPDEGLFDKIELRLRRRRAMRVGGAVMGLLAVVGVAAWLLRPQPRVEVVAVPAPAPVPPAEVLQPRQEAPVLAVPTHRKPAPVAAEAAELGAVAEETPAMVAELEPAPEQPVVEPVSAEMEEWHGAEAAPVAESEEQQEPEAEVVMEAKGEPTPPEVPHYDNVLWAPNIIIPTADDERNRLFRLTATSSVSDFHLYIFNRGGRQVFSSEDINEGWNATFDGQPVSQGSYVWVAKFRDSNGVARQEQGTLTVVR